jgi:hypothetical protein
LARPADPSEEDKWAYRVKGERDLLPEKRCVIWMVAKDGFIVPSSFIHNQDLTMEIVAGGKRKKHRCTGKIFRFAPDKSPKRRLCRKGLPRRWHSFGRITGYPEVTLR